MILGPCPTCGARHEIDALILHDYLRQAVVSALGLPRELSARIVRYLRLFVSDKAPQRALQPDRAAVLLEQLNKAIAEGKIEARGRAWSAPLPVWSAALDAVFEAVESGRKQKPLPNHSYLYGVIANMTDAKESKDEEAREQARKTGVRQTTQADQTHSRASLHKAAPTLGHVERNDSFDEQLRQPGADSHTRDAAASADARIGGIPLASLAVMQQFASRKTLASASASVEPADVDPLINCMVRIASGQWKGRGGKVIRVVGATVHVLIQFPRLGERVIQFERKQVEQ
jgi:hypothetical protein